MPTSISSDAAMAAVDAVTAAIMSGTEEPASQIIVFSGTAPLLSSAVDPEDNALLVSFDVPVSGFGGAAMVGNSAEALLSNVSAADAVGAGEASFFRVYNRDGAVVMQGDIGEVGQQSNAPMILNQITVTVGASVSISRFVVGMSIG